MTTDAGFPQAQGREDLVLERVTAFRRRRPRLLEDIVTLAHGAGGKSSAALVDSVFLDAFRNPELEQLGDGAVLTLPSGDRHDMWLGLEELLTWNPQRDVAKPYPAAADPLPLGGPP